MASIEKRKANDGSVSYRVKIRRKGVPLQTATFNRLTDAKKWINVVEGAIVQGRHFPGSEARKRTLGNLIDRYMEDVLPREKPHAQHDKPVHFHWWRERYGNLSLASVTPAILTEGRDALAKEETHVGKKRAPATVNRYMNTLSRAFTLAEKEWGWIESNPFRKVSKLKEPRGRLRFLDKKEISRLLDVCATNEPLYTIVLILLTTGARKGEVLNLTWDDVDFSRNILTFTKTKNDETRSVAMVPDVRERLLEESRVRTLGNDLVFPGNTGEPRLVQKSFERAVKRAGIKNCTLHTLRHTWASHAAMNGVSLLEIAGVLGHKTIQMTKRYSHLSNDHTVQVVHSVAANILSGDAEERKAE